MVLMGTYTFIDECRKSRSGNNVEVVNIELEEYTTNATTNNYDNLNEIHDDNEKIINNNNFDTENNVTLESPETLQELKTKYNRFVIFVLCML